MRQLAGAIRLQFPRPSAKNSKGMRQQTPLLPTPPLLLLLPLKKVSNKFQQ
jgi:hypothetical protein